MTRWERCVYALPIGQPLASASAYRVLLTQLSNLVVYTWTCFLSLARYIYTIVRESEGGERCIEMTYPHLENGMIFIDYLDIGRFLRAFTEPRSSTGTLV